MKSTHRSPRRLNRSVLTCALASCLLVVAPQVLAQSSGATLSGRVDGVAAVTEVTATNTATGAVRRTRTNADGGYTLVGLEPGTYTVEAGPGTAQTVRLSVASSSTLNLAAGAAPAAGGGATDLDTVTVTAPPLLQDVKTSEVGKTVSLREIQTVPQTSRNFLEFADAVPGIVFTRDTNGKSAIRGGAQSSDGINVYIDGVGQKSYVNKGGISGQNGSPGNPFPQLAIGEYKVITSNYKAEYGQISSAAVTAVTKSGTNEFHGDMFYRYTNDDMRAKTVPEKQPGKEKADTFEKEYGFALGGPIIQDRMHFFVTYEAKKFALPGAVTADGLAANGIPFLPPAVAAEFGPVSKPFDEDLYFAKIDWEVTDNDRIEVSGQYRDESQLDGISGVSAPSHGFSVINTDKRFNLRWEHSGESFFNELLATTEDSSYAPTAVNFGNGSIYTYQNPDRADDRPTIISVGPADPRSTQVKGQKGWSLEDNLTFNNFTWNGDHVIKMGARYKSIDLQASDSINDNPQFFYNVTEAGTNPIPYQAIFPKSLGVAGTAPQVTSEAEQIGLYIQDDWSVNDNLVLNIGLRWDYEKNPSYLDFVTPANVVAALNSPDPAAPGQTYAQTLANGGIDINDYISTGNNREAFDGAFQPRLGFSYDINADEQHVIHGGAGRSYDRDLFTYIQLEVTKLALSQPTISFRDGPDGTCYRQGSQPCFTWDPNFLNGVGNLQGLVAGSTSGAEVDLLNNELEAPYSDQFSIGMSNTIGDWLTDATIGRVLSYNGFAFTLGQRYPNGDFFQNGGQPWGNGIPGGFGALLLGDNGIETRTTQVLLSTQKPYTKDTGWGATFAYTYTDAVQNRAIDETYAFDAGRISDYPFITSNATPKHRFVATSSFDGPWGILFGAKLTLSTPLPLNDFAINPTTEPDVANAIPAATIPGGNGRFLVGGKVWGFRSLDLQATKEFNLGSDVRMYGRLDIINVLDFDNVINYTIDQTDRTRLRASYNQNGDITGLPRTVKVEVGLKF